MIEIKQLATYAGPSPYASVPVIVVSLIISPDEISEAPRRILLVQAACASWFAWSTGAAPTNAAGVGRFLLAWAGAAQSEFGAELKFGTVTVEDGETKLVLECEVPEVTHKALLLAAKIFTEIEKLSTAELDQLVQEFWALSNRLHPDYQAQFLINYTRKHRIPYRRFIPNTFFWHYGWGARSEVFLETSPMDDSATGRTWCRNKVAAKKLFASIGAPVAPGIQVKNESELAAARDKVGFPCITKPTDRGRSLGVTLNITDSEKLVQGYRAALEHTRAPVMVEKHIEGEVYRLMVIRGKFWRAIRRGRPFVVGDGKSTILALTEALHAEGLKRVRPGNVWKPAPIDDTFRATLLEQNLSPDDVPPKGARIRLRNIPQIVQGGDYSDVTAATHPDVKVMSEAVAELFGIKVCGLDYMTRDISKSCFEHGAFLEINTTPGVRIPFVGGVPAEDIAHAFLGDKPSRLPLILIIAPGTHHERIHPQLPRNPRVGWICGPRAGIGAIEFLDRKSTYHPHLERIVRNKAVEAVVLVCAMDKIAAKGMPAPHAQLTIFIDSATLMPAWTTVLNNHSDQTIETSAVEELPKIIASTLAWRDLPSLSPTSERIRHPQS